eukprot:TRINITY_DN64382_c0_g1_i1.p2 TRINITY_DN64382_c0_g1~~TRINITY_DN64382_c0_g1_i1.p2  ORF type:complete len:379 (-),score=45.24 TRINITY_DN64382_c0_g1_i1:1435-2550(-)
MKCCLLVISCILLVSAWSPPKGFPKRMPKATINLDAKPEDRWNPVIDDVIRTHGWDNSFSNIMKYWDGDIPKDIRAVVEYFAAKAEGVLDPEYLAELKGVTAAYNKYAPHGTMKISQVIALNLMYELTSECTSIVSVDKNNTIWHSRNLDWGLPTGVHFTNFTYLIDFQRGGKTVYSGVHFVGFVGSLTGLRPGGFGVTIDQRYTVNLAQVLKNIDHLEKDHAAPVTWLARKVLDVNTTYGQAEKALATRPIAGPAFYIVSGLHHDEGAILARDWNYTVRGPWEMPNGPKPWYILETNYDHWLPPVPGDDRRRVGEDAMNKLGQNNVNAANLFKIMQTPGTWWSRGTLNSETLYTIVMSAEKQHFDAYLMQ